MSLKHCLISLACAASLFTGCAATKYAEPNVTPQAALLTINDARTATYQPNTVRLIAKVDYYDGSQNKRVVGRDFVISAQAPANLRVTLSSFDKALSTLVTNGYTFGLLDAMNNVFVTGRATPQNLAQILPLYLSAHDLFRVLISQYPDENVDSLISEQLEWDSSVGGYRQDLQLKDGRIQHVFHAYPSGDLVRMTITNGDKLEYDFQASDFAVFKSHADDDLDEDVRAASEPNSVRLPQTIVFSLKPQKTDVRLRIESYDIDVDFVPQVFDLVPPPGTPVAVLRDPNEPPVSALPAVVPQEISDEVDPSDVIQSSDNAQDSQNNEDHPEASDLSLANASSDSVAQ